MKKEEVEKYLNLKEYIEVAKELIECDCNEHREMLFDVLISFFKNFFLKDEKISFQIQVLIAIIISNNIKLGEILIKSEDFKILYNAKLFTFILLLQNIWTENTLEQLNIDVGTKYKAYMLLEKLKKGKIIYYLFKPLVRYKNILIHIKIGNEIEWLNMCKAKEIEKVKKCRDLLIGTKLNSLDEYRSAIDGALSKLDELEDDLKETINNYSDFENDVLMMNAFKSMHIVMQKACEKVMQFVDDKKTYGKMKCRKILENLVTEHNEISLLVMFEVAAFYNNHSLSLSNEKLRKKVTAKLSAYEKIENVAKELSKFKVEKVMSSIDEHEKWFKNPNSFFANCTEILSEGLSKFIFNFWKSVMMLVKDNNDTDDIVDDLWECISNFEEKINNLKKKFLFSSVNVNDYEYPINEEQTLKVSEIKKIVICKLDEDNKCALCNKKSVPCPVCGNASFCKSHNKEKCIWCGACF